MVIPQNLRSKLLIVDPHTGFQVAHVKDCDPDPEKGWLEVYTTTPCCNDPDMQMLVVTKDKDGKEQTDRRNYTFMVITDTGTGNQHYATRRLTGVAFDVISRVTGEVMYEVPLSGRIPELYLDPAAAAAKMQALPEAQPERRL